MERLDFVKTSKLEFEAPDPVRFPALRLARECLETGGHAPNVMNAANEVAVSAFLDNRLSYLGISRVVEATLEHIVSEVNLSQTPENVAHIVRIDQLSREIAKQIVVRTQ